MANKILGNHKMFIGGCIYIDTSVDPPRCYCFICQRIYDDASSSANFKAHMIADHGFVDWA